jgi:hypothetical protein
LSESQLLEGIVREIETLLAPNDDSCGNVGPGG